MYQVGITSLPVVLVTAFFTGAVTAWQVAYQFGDYIPLSFMGMAVGKAVMLELGPVLTALIVACRIGSAMAAELGTMKVTEQIDAMECLTMDPFRFLYAPRMAASLVMIPTLVILSSIVGIFGAFLVANLIFGLGSHAFFESIRTMVPAEDLIITFYKAVVFGIIIALMGTYYGHNTTGGASGVGVSTKAAVVVSSVWILIMDYVVVGLFI